MSKKQKMDPETDKEPIKDSPTLCSNNCGFFGSPETNNYCSKCYKEFVLIRSNEKGKGKLDIDEESNNNNVKGETTQVEKIVVLEKGKEEIINRTITNRCGVCRKRVGLTGFKCKCGHTFCSVHRYSDKHDCVFDYKGAGQEEIAKANPIVKADKVDKI